MNALVSGQAKTAVLIDGDVYRSFHLYEPETLRIQDKSDFRCLFGEALDLRFLKDTDPEAVLTELQLDSNKASALNLAMMLLDIEISDAKPFVADALEDLLEEEAVSDYLESVLYANALPADADIERVLRLCSGTFTKTHTWFSGLLEKQDDITFVRETWDNLPASIFKDQKTHADFERAFIHERVFRDLVLMRDDSATLGPLNLRVRMLKSITVLPNYRSVLQELFAPFSQPRVSEEEKRLLKDEEDEPFRLRERPPQSFNREAVRQSVQQQIEYIAELLRKRDLASAQKTVDQLMDYQTGKGEPIHRVKSLCQIAQKAKDFGFYEFQLELTGRAIDLEYNDAWTQVQHADALLQNGRLNEALAVYEETRRDHPENVVAKTGHAEILKELGRLNEALVIYEETRRDHPEDVVAKNGYAEILKELGRLSEALVIYEETRRDHPEDVVAKTGHAEILKELGRLSEALAIYEETRRDRPDDIVVQRGYAEVLKKQGNLEEAYSVYRSLLDSGASEIRTRNGIGGVLFALRKYDEALTHLPLDGMVTHSDWIGFHIRGMIMLKKGDLDESIRIFEKGASEDPIPSGREYFRGALAIARLRQGELEKASELLTENAVTPVLEPAISILRAHAFGERGLFSDARKAFYSYEHAPIIRSVAGYKNSGVLELADEVKNRYVTLRVRSKPDAWLFDLEEEMLMALAA